MLKLMGKEIVTIVMFKSFVDLNLLFLIELLHVLQLMHKLHYSNAATDIKFSNTELNFLFNLKWQVLLSS